MPAALKARLRAQLRRMRPPLPRGRTLHRLLWAICGACFLAGLCYHLARGGSAPGRLLAFAYEVVLLAGFAALWFALRPRFEGRPPTPLHALWTPIVAGLLFGALAGLVRLAGIPAAPRLGNTELYVLSLLEMGFFFFLLLQLRRLVLYRRTRKTQRYWRLMLGLMTVAALSALGRPAGSNPGALQIVFIVPAVLLMVLNSFRLSWVVDLPMKRKLAGAGLALGLMIAIGIAGNADDANLPLAEAESFLKQHNPSLGLFIMLAAVFGILYSVTMLLSLIFHLPTTGEVQRKSDEMTTLQSMARLVSQAFDGERLSRTIAAAPVEAGLADAAWLALDGASERLVQGEVTPGPQVVAACQISAVRAARAVDTDAFFDEVRRTHTPLSLPYASSDPRVKARPGDGLSSLLVVPLMARDTFAGALFASKNVSRGFEKDDRASIQTFASQAGLALDHARLFEEQIEKERLARELDIARTVQERLLPHRPPDVAGLTLSASSTPAREVGGDYYDFACLDDGRLAFIIADVSGKGTSAAFYMAEMQGLFRSTCRLRPAPVDFLSHVNGALSGVLDGGAFVTALYGLLDPKRGQLRLARAGHCPPVLSRLGRTARFLRPAGMGLGLTGGPLFRQTLAEEQLTLQPGDTLTLYTDGLVESRRARGEEYGFDRLLQALKERCRDHPSALRTGLLSDLRAFTGGDAYDDDLTLVVLRWSGTPAPHAAPACDAAASEETSEVHARPRKALDAP